MAAPPSLTCANLNGKYSMNKSLSDDLDAMLSLQNIGWFLRKAINLASVNMTIKEYKTDGVYHIDATNVAAGVASTQEDRILDWTERDHNDKIFGHMKGKSRMFTKGSFQMEGPGPEEDQLFLLGEKLKDGKTDTHFLDDEHVQSWVRNVDSRGGGGWTGEQVWGFEEINGIRYHTRRVCVRHGDKREYVRLVYDYKGPLDKDDDGLAYGE